MGAVAVSMGLLATRVAYDDAWITYRYAHNLASGQGLVYNVGERYLGTSAPGYAVMLAVLGRPWPELIPAIGAGVCVVSLAAVALALFDLDRRHGGGYAGLFAGVLFAVNPVALEAFGGEMLTQAALVLWAFAAQARGRPQLAAALGLAAAIVRPDGMVALSVILLAEAWTTRRVPWRSLAVAVVGAGAWFGTLWLYDGSPLPHTVGAKHAQRASGIWYGFSDGLVSWFGALTLHGSTLFYARPSAGFTAFTYLGAAGAIIVPRCRQWWPVAVWTLLDIAAYRFLDVPFYHWYAVPPLVLLSVLAGVAIDFAVRLAPAGRSRVVATTVACVCVALPLAWQSASIVAGRPHQIERAYEAVGRWLATNTPEDSSAGYLEIGLIGYYSRRRIVDPLGLVNPGVAPHVRTRDFLYAYRHYRPDYVLNNPAFFPDYLGRVVREAWFEREDRPVATLPSGRPDPIVVYRRIAQ